MLTPIVAEEALQALGRAARGGDSAEVGSWVRWLVSLAPSDLVRVDERARVMAWAPGPLGPASEWAGADLRDLLSAAAASMHPNGHLRERAVDALGVAARDGEGGVLATRALAVRATDHVPQVRATALSALLARTGYADARHVFAILHAVAERAQGAVALDAYHGAYTARHGSDGARALLTSPDRRTKRAALSECLVGDTLSGDELWVMLASEPDQLCQHLMMQHLVDHAAADRIRGRLLNGRRSEGRVLALYRLPPGQVLVGDVEARLLDRSRRVRDAARWRAGEAGVQPAVFYRRVWEARPPEPDCAVVLDGLRETGQSLDSETLEALVRAPAARTQLAGLRLAQPAQLDAGTLLSLLCDPSGRVARAAARMLTRRPDVGYDDLDRAAQSLQPSTRRAAWWVRRERGSWDRVRNNLECFGSADELLATRARTDLNDWLQTSAATTWQPPTPAQGKAIQSALFRTAVPDRVRRAIAFHAGIEAASDA